MRKYIFIISCIFIVFRTNAQDEVIKTDGTIIDCRINSVDSVNIFLTVFSADDTSDIYYTLSEIHSYTYNGNTIIINDIEKIIEEYVPDRNIPLVEKTLNCSYIISYGNDTIKGKSVVFKTPFMGIRHFLVDSVRISPEIVKYYNNAFGFYANTRHLNAFFNSEFAKRVDTGKINRFELQIEKSLPMNNYSAGHFDQMSNTYIPGSPIGGFGDFTWTKTKYYYNIGSGDLKSANYKNLMQDCSDNKDCVKKIKKIRTNDYMIAGCLLAGTAIMIPSIINTIDNDASPALIIVGALVFNLNMLFVFLKPDIVKDALVTYNRK